MKAFMDDHFMLNSEVAEALYHQYAKPMPIIDYHCHLSPAEIDGDRTFANMTEIWLAGDHYKWRAMRSRGIDERYITGDADDKEKFAAWAKTVPYCIGNPLYHWTHLELQRYFDFHEPLDGNNWERVWEHCNRIVTGEAFTVRNIIRSSNVKVICTTDDPTDSLVHHKRIRADGELETSVLPTFRPDKGLEINKPSFRPFVEALGSAVRAADGESGSFAARRGNRASGNSAAETGIRTYEDFLQALESRARYFHEAGCRISDHGMEYVPFEPCTLAEAESIFRLALSGESVTPEQEAKYKTFTLLHLGKLYASLNWTMQLHIGAIRNNNTRMYRKLGPDTGFDSIGDAPVARPLNALLDALEQESGLPRTILYNLNATDNDIMASALGNFQSGGVKGKIQFGSGWWFNDTKDGMLKQMVSLSNMGLLANFVGMLTDSRSFLSYTRHEYFRRILCDMLGSWADKGEIPGDIGFLGQIVEDICYNNARDYFQFDK